MDPLTKIEEFLLKFREVAELEELEELENIKRYDAAKKRKQVFIDADEVFKMIEAI